MIRAKRIAALSVLLTAIAVTLFTNPSCKKQNPLAKHKVLVLGIDGMDYRITTDLLSKGKLPNFAKLAQTGGFKPLISSIPAQSPVAWSNFITGKNPGGHGIFDFIHRDPKTMIPYLSTSEAIPPSHYLSLFKYRIPLDSGEVKLLRGGEAFWQILDREGIPSVIFKIPSNFPPAPFSGKSLSDMGTPDIQGTYGMFSYFTDNPPENAEKFTGGKAYTVWVEGNEVRAELVGPKNTFLNESPEPDAVCPFKVFVDPDRNVAKIEINDQELVLAVGDWSPWVEVNFHMAPGVNTAGIVRFYLKEVHPNFKLFATPVNIDPLNPAMPITTPPDYAKKLATDLGLFYTQGMPENVKALQYGVLNDDEYAQQIKIVLDEREQQYRYELNNWKDGLLFFYFGSLDQNQHTWWRAMDKENALWTPELAAKYGDFIEKLYIEMDRMLEEALKNIGPEDTLIVMSDHGFAPYNRQFNLNSWLLDNGYITLLDPASRSTVEYLEGVDWTQTRVYSLGINALYINLNGREKDGIVDPAEADALIREIAGKLEAVVDPKTGKHPIRKAYISKDVFSGPYVEQAPDIIVGYDRGYRGSDESALGGFPNEILSDNKSTWSGDHCIDPAVVPGVFFSNRKITAEMPYLYDLTVTVLKEYNITPPQDMIGKPVW